MKADISEIKRNMALKEVEENKKSQGASAGVVITTPEKVQKDEAVEETPPESPPALDVFGTDFGSSGTIS